MRTNYNNVKLMYAQKTFIIFGYATHNPTKRKFHQIAISFTFNQTNYKTLKQNFGKRNSQGSFATHKCRL